MLEKTVQTKPPTPLSAQVSQLDLANKKRKQDQNGKEVVDERKGHPSKEAKPQKGSKLAKTTQIRSFSEGAIVDKRSDHQAKVPAWTPSIVCEKHRKIG